MSRKVKIGVVGYGRMGRGFVAAMQADGRYEIAALCDANEATRALAACSLPGTAVYADTDAMFADARKLGLDAVGLFTLADARPDLIRAALKRKLHVLAEKPIAADVKTEWALVDEIERSGRIVAVNLFNRNAWYHQEILDFIGTGQIGKLAIVRICHMTPGHMPGEGHDPEGPPFHDCGMHYADVARWYAQSEYKTWHAQGVRMWSHSDPWWVQAHGTFENGVVFDLTQGFVYGHLAKDKVFNCYVDAIGTQGICRMRHDFRNATIECHGVTETLVKTQPYNDKKLDVMVDAFARSVLSGTNVGCPNARDSVVASEASWAMLEDAIKNDPPPIGTQTELTAILEHRRTLREGFGLPSRPHVDAHAVASVAACAGVGSHGCGPVTVTMPPVQSSPTIELPPIAPSACSMG